MRARQIRENVHWMGAVDWDRRLFDSLIPLPDGTSYNAYLIQGSDKTVLVDSVDPAKADTLLTQLQNVPQVDYVIAHHAEQDHSGSIPLVLERYPEARVIATPKGVEMLIDHLEGAAPLTPESSRSDFPCRLIERDSCGPPPDRASSGDKS